MSAHEPGHERVLDALFTADDPARAFHQSPLASCGACRERLEAHVELTRTLDRVAARERAEITRALAGPEAARGPAEAALLAAMRSPPALPVPRQRRHVVPWLLAAAAGIAALLLWRFLAPTPRTDDGMLLGQGIELLAPVGEVESFGLFHWDYEGLGEGWFQVVVLPADAAPGSEPIVSGPLKRNEWRPDPEMVARWGKRIRWRLEVYRGTGGDDRLDSALASASLR